MPWRQYSRMLFAILLCLGTASVSYAAGRDQILVNQKPDLVWSASVGGIFNSSKSYAVVIGISNYIGENNGGYPALHTERDAEKMADFLLKDQGFAYVHVLTESEATKEKIDKIMTDEMPRMIG